MVPIFNWSMLSASLFFFFFALQSFLWNYSWAVAAQPSPITHHPVDAAATWNLPPNFSLFAADAAAPKYKEPDIYLQCKMEYQQKVKKTANVSYAREATSFHIWRAFVDYSLVCVCLLRATLWNSSQMKNDAQIMKIINWVHIFPSKWRVASMRTKK